MRLIHHVPILLTGHPRKLRKGQCQNRDAFRDTDSEGPIDAGEEDQEASWYSDVE